MHHMTEFPPATIGKLGGAVASWLVRSTPDPVTRVRALAVIIVLCVMFLSKTLYSHSASLHPGIQMSTSKYAGGNPAMD